MTTTTPPVSDERTSGDNDLLHLVGASATGGSLITLLIIRIVLVDEMSSRLDNLTQVLVELITAGALVILATWRIALPTVFRIVFVADALVLGVIALDRLR